MICLLHPGGTDMTMRLADMAAFSQGQRVLDLGCGDGAGIELLRERYGLQVTGCDINPEMVKIAKKRNPKCMIKHCDGVSLDFPSLYFDGAVLECSFSLMDRHEELLHELYCVLKPGAILAISDLYMLKPDPERVKRETAAARAFLNREHSEGDCENDEESPSPFRIDGMFILSLLTKAIEESGFEIIRHEDATEELRAYVGQVLMDYGSFENMRLETLPQTVLNRKESENIINGKLKYSNNTGYFLLTAQKKSA